MLGSTFIRIYFHAYVYLFEYFNSRNINITPSSMCSCPCCRILVMILKMYIRHKLKAIFTYKKCTITVSLRADPIIYFFYFIKCYLVETKILILNIYKT